MRYMCVPLSQQSTPSSYLYVVIFAPSPLRRVLSVSCALNTNLDIRIFECFFLLSFELLLLLLFLLLLMARVAVTFLFTSFGDLIFLFSAFFPLPNNQPIIRMIYECAGEKNELLLAQWVESEKLWRENMKLPKVALRHIITCVMILWQVYFERQLLNSSKIKSNVWDWDWDCFV